MTELLKELLQVEREPGLQFLETDREQEQFVLQGGIRGYRGAIAPSEEKSALAGEHAVDLGKSLRRPLWIKRRIQVVGGRPAEDLIKMRHQLPFDKAAVARDRVTFGNHDINRQTKAKLVTQQLQLP